MEVNPHWISEKIAIYGQIQEGHLKELKELGFKSIICNRPDLEGGYSQPSSALLKQKAEQLSLDFHYLPVESVYQSPDEAQKMAHLLKTVGFPTLVFCRSGGRSISLLALANQLGFLELEL